MRGETLAHGSQDRTKDLQMHVLAKPRLKSILCDQRTKISCSFENIISK